MAERAVAADGLASTQEHAMTKDRQHLTTTADAGIIIELREEDLSKVAGGTGKTSQKKPQAEYLEYKLTEVSLSHFSIG
jgi:hypothetical protein